MSGLDDFIDQLAAALRQTTPDAGDMQAEVDKWMDACFGETIKAVQTERADRVECPRSNRRSEMSGLADELLPCPFCGGDGAFLRTAVDGSAHIVGCANCPCCIGIQGEQEAIAAWNTRAALRQPAPDADDGGAEIECPDCQGWGMSRFGEPGPGLIGFPGVDVCLLCKGKGRCTPTEAEALRQTAPDAGDMQGLVERLFEAAAEIQSLTAELAATATASGERLKNLGAERAARAHETEAYWKALELRPTAADLSVERAKVAELVEGLKSLEPFLDAIVCYASTMDEYEPNRIAQNARALLERMKP